MQDKSQRRILGLPKNIFFLGLTSFFNDFSSEMVFSVFPAFFTSVLHAGAASLGMVDGIAEAASNLFKIYSGHLSDKFQKRKPLMIGGYSLSVITRPFYVFVSGVGGILGLRFLDRVGKGMREAPRDAIISLSAPKEELGKSFGYHRAMDTAGAILGPLVAYILLRLFPQDFNTVFLSAFVVGILAVATLFLVSDVVGKRDAKRPSLIATLGGLTTQFKIFLLAIFVLSIGSLPVAVMLLKTQSIGLLIADIPLFYMVYSISYAAFSIAAGKVSDKFGAPVVIVAGYVVLILSYALLNFAESAQSLVIGFLVLGLFPALTDGVQRAFASKLIPAESRGGGMGLLSAATGFGALVAGIAGGYLWQHFTPEAAFISAGSIVIVGLFLFLVAVKMRTHVA